MISQVKPHLLIVDDEQPNLDTFRRVFYRDFEMRFSTNSTEALAILESEEFDVVVTDYSMPELDGVEFARLAKLVRPDVGIIMVTGYSELEEVQKAVQSGLLINLESKPWNPATLRNTIRLAASVARLNQSVRKSQTRPDPLNADFK